MCMPWLVRSHIHSAVWLLLQVNLCDKEKNPQGRLVSMFDMTSCSMANMDVSCMKDILGLLSAHYVECLSAMYIYNPPLVFWGLWNTFKVLLPPVTREKIKVIDPKDLTELRALVPDDVSAVLAKLASVQPCQQ